MIVMAIGDTHGARGVTRDAIRWAAENAVDRIVQVGDFGFWPRMNNGQKFLHDVGKLASDLGVWFGFIDGNHEDHTVLDAIRLSDATPFIPYGKYPLYYIRRGARWEWDDCAFGAFGGAYSIDRRDRIEDSREYGWFRQEMPDESVISNLGKVDVLFTHDAPIVPPCLYTTSHFKRDDMSQASQRFVYEAMHVSKPSLLIHGHWHVHERYGVAGVTVQGLGNLDEHSLCHSAVVFDTSDRRLYNLRQWEYRDGQETTNN